MRFFCLISLTSAVLSGCLVSTGGQAIPSAPPNTPTHISTSQPILATGYAKLPAPPGTLPYFVNLKQGDLVSRPVKIKVGLLRMGAAPVAASTPSWHHLLLVNVPAVDLNATLPVDANHQHFGAGQTEIQLDLAPGAHTLQLLLADPNHISYHPAVMSERITILVQ